MSDTAHIHAELDRIEDTRTSDDMLQAEGPDKMVVPWEVIYGPPTDTERERLARVREIRTGEREPFKRVGEISPSGEQERLDG